MSVVIALIAKVVVNPTSIRSWPGRPLLQLGFAVCKLKYLAKMLLIWHYWYLKLMNYHVQEFKGCNDPF
jgi:hypothetical protein